MSEDDSELEPKEDSSEKNEEEGQGSEELSPEEQMALYEESLKETDWGHQPC